LVLKYISDWKKGLFIITQKEYLRMPNKLRMCIDIYDIYLFEMKENNKELK